MSAVFTSQTGGVVVRAPAADRQWLEAFLAPTVTVTGDADTALARVNLVDAPASATQAPTGADRVAFVLDRRPVRLSELATPDAMLYRDPELHLSYSVREVGRDVTVHRGGRGDLARMALMRVAREYAHNALIDSGGLVLHAAALAGARGAVLVTGPKGVGKTTLLAWMLSEGQLTYLANDRVGITPDLHSALSIPTIVAVRAGTRRLLPELEGQLRPLGRFTELDVPSGRRDLPRLLACWSNRSWAPTQVCSSPRSSGPPRPRRTSPPGFTPAAVVWPASSPATRCPRPHRWIAPHSPGCDGYAGRRAGAASAGRAWSSGPESRVRAPAAVEAEDRLAAGAGGWRSGEAAKAAERGCSCPDRRVPPRGDAGRIAARVRPRRPLAGDRVRPGPPCACHNELGAAACRRGPADGRDPRLATPTTPATPATSST